MKKRFKKIFALLLTMALLGASLPPAAAAPSDELRIGSAEELIAFAEKCSLDSWSRGKTVVITADIDLTGTDFACIPTFGGVFDGGGHKIYGFSITVSGSELGFFRMLQRGAVVKDLHLGGSVTPGGSRSRVGGIVGRNEGSIYGCTFAGTVEGDGSVGGIAGINLESGEITASLVSGSITGSSCTGGIVGKNLGSIIKCENRAMVNATLETSSGGVSFTGVAGLLSGGDESSVESALTEGSSDTGGIAGLSSGIVQSCRNIGTIGYAHVGYNVGGIAGRQTGYLLDCSNSGSVCGRKDVGGIVGQSEPYIIMNVSAGSLEELRAELNRLNSLIDSALADTDASSADISARLERISQNADSASDSTKALLDCVGDFVDGNIETINGISSAVHRALDDISPAMDDLSAASDALSTAFERLDAALDTLAKASDTSAELLSHAQLSVKALTAANSDLMLAFDNIDKALASLERSVSIKDEDAVDAALEQLSAAIKNAGTATDDLGKALKALSDALGSGGWNVSDDVLNALRDAADAASRLGASLSDAANAIDTISANVDISWSEIRSALKSLSDALDDIRNAADDFDTAAKELDSALSQAETLSRELSEAFRQLSEVSSALSTASASLSSAFDGIGSAVDTLRDEGAPEFVALGEDYRDASDGLYSAVEGMSSELSALNGELLGAEQTLSADLLEISRQMSVVMNLVIDRLGELQNTVTDPDISDYIEDTSDVDVSGTTRGKILSSENSGPVEGDRSVGGIAGSMAIEYELDPEDDSALRLSYNTTYETKAVIESCVNRGSVECKKDCAGGIVGRMELGTVTGCESYGLTESSSGSNVGGIAGSSDAKILSSFAKCRLSGEKYVGGIAGSGGTIRACLAFVSISGGSEYVGAIAGKAAADSVTACRFVENGQAGIDGISYSGHAEPVDFSVIAAEDGIPAEFLRFTLTLSADGEVIAELPFDYGDDLSQLELPPVPEKDGSFGRWEDFDTSGKCSDVYVNAVYDHIITLLPSEETSGQLAIALAEGSFTDEAELHAVSSSVAPPDGANGAEVYDISLSGADVSGAVTLRLLCPDEKAGIYEYVSGGWTKLSPEFNSSYALVSLTDGSGTFCVAPARTSPIALYILLPAALAAALVIFILLRRRRAKKRKAA